MENAVAIEELGLTVEAVERLGFRIVKNWACAPAVTQKDAHALTRRRQMISEQRAVERRCREAEQAAEFARQIPRGVPVVPGATPVESLYAADAGSRPPSVREQLLDAELAHGKG